MSVSLAAGVSIVRVHDVAEMADVVEVMNAIRGRRILDRNADTR